MHSKINALGLKKIFISISIVLAVVAIATGSTFAFFSDMEKSEGNIFSAGQLDLRVDSESHYNGLVCTEDQWESWHWTNPNPVICNDDDSEAVAWGNFVGIKTAEAGVGSIDDECQEYGYDFGIAKWEWEGGKYLAEGDANNTFVWGDAELANWVSSTTISGILRKAGQNTSILDGGISGIVEEYCFQDNKHKKCAEKCKDISHITFCGNDDEPVCGDCIVDDGEECDGGIFCTNDCRLIEEEDCVGTWEETDLEDGIHKFFNFINIKPGDKGEDTISLHVYDNDAWGRLRIDSIQDKENGCIDSAEIDAEPDCMTDNGPGELRENMIFEFWLDQGSVPGFQNTVDNLSNLKCPTCDFDETEGDNIRQDDDEPLLFGPEAIAPNGENWDFKDVLMNAYLSDCVGQDPQGDNDYEYCHGLASDGRMVAGTTYYFGLGWHLPFGDSDEINKMQSDIFAGDMIFEIEQHRHNDDGFED